MSGKKRKKEKKKLKSPRAWRPDTGSSTAVRYRKCTVGREVERINTLGLELCVC